MSEDGKPGSAMPWAVAFWVAFALVLVVAFNIWPELAPGSPWRHPWLVAGFFTVMLLAGGIWRRVRQR